MHTGPRASPRETAQPGGAGTANGQGETMEEKRRAKKEKARQGGRGAPRAGPSPAEAGTRAAPPRVKTGRPPGHGPTGVSPPQASERRGGPSGNRAATDRPLDGPKPGKPPPHGRGPGEPPNRQAAGTQSSGAARAGKPLGKRNALPPTHARPNNPPPEGGERGPAAPGRDAHASASTAKAGEGRARCKARPGERSREAGPWHWPGHRGKHARESHRYNTRAVPRPRPGRQPAFSQAHRESLFPAGPSPRKPQGGSPPQAENRRGTRRRHSSLLSICFPVLSRSFFPHPPPRRGGLHTVPMPPPLTLLLPEQARRPDPALQPQTPPTGRRAKARDVGSGKRGKPGLSGRGGAGRGGR
ncbi:basic salivary proline-rich protein 4-like [Talpa occidentalis]|uniref:basic salivary proline-rich protein 4-like n=1 Tax=Talpa occidentalis TaxID=50954 RepID=UPI00188FF31B|nr:basic salivary proline-rich protein 4-like [Talpa occidentalis]